MSVFEAMAGGASEPWLNRRDLSISTSNFDEPEPWSNRRSILVAVPVTCLLVAWLCVLGRLYTRFFIIKALWWDDLFVFLYGLSATLGTVTMIKSIDFGFGKHFLTLEIDTMMIFLKHFYIVNASYVVSTTLIKLSLLLQYLRIFERSTFAHRLCIIVCIFTALWGLAYSFISWVPCFPPNNYWNLMLDDGSCYGFGSRQVSHLLAAYESHTAINMALDLVVLLIPVQLLWRTGATMAQRLRLLCLLCLGAPVIAFAAWRLATIVEHEATTKPVFDPTWYSPLSILLALFEVDAAAICGSVPIFWPQIRKHWSSLNHILVVHEVRITSESRGSENDLAEVGTDNDNDEAKLTRSGASAGRTRRGSSTSRGSAMESEMDEIDVGRKRRQHYEDTYIIGQVDPFRSPKGVVQVEARPTEKDDPGDRY